jgi:hypothetical protein
MTITTTNLETVLNAKVVAATETTDNKELLLLSKSIEAIDSSLSLKPADIGVSVQGYNADIATGTSVDAKISNLMSELVDSSPSTLNTIQEISTALGDDSNHVATMTTLIGNKMNTLDPTFTGELDGAGNTYTNLHPSVISVSHSGSYNIDLSYPFVDSYLTGAITYSSTNKLAGRMSVIYIRKSGSAVGISFGAEFKWSDDTEPTWGDYSYWVVSLTCVSSTNILASAQGFIL